MRRWQMTQQGLKGLFLVVLILAGCSATGGGDNPEQGCGGTEAAVSCLNIVSIAPKDATGTVTSNVDAFAHICTIDPVTGQVLTVEHLPDHNADVTFSNTKFPTALSTFDIRIVSFSVSYKLNDCPRNATGCPPLPGFTVSSETIVVTAGGMVVRTLPLVPLRVKDAYVTAGGELGVASPSYSAFYVFTAQTIGLNDTFTVEANTEFTITDFSNACSPP
jgi:hypothetical protein